MVKAGNVATIREAHSELAQAAQAIADALYAGAMADADEMADDMDFDDDYDEEIPPKKSGDGNEADKAEETDRKDAPASE